MRSPWSHHVWNEVWKSCQSVNAARNHKCAAPTSHTEYQSFEVNFSFLCVWFLSLLCLLHSGRAERTAACWKRRWRGWGRSWRGWRKPKKNWSIWSWRKRSVVQSCGSVYSTFWYTHYCNTSHYLHEMEFLKVHCVCLHIISPVFLNAESWL